MVEPEVDYRDIKSYREKRVISQWCDNVNSKLTNEAMQYVKESDEVIKTTSQKIQELFNHKMQVKEKFIQALTEIEEERRYSLSQINDKYDREVRLH